MTTTYIIDDKRKTQTDMIYEHLCKKGSITNVEAANIYKARSLTKRIHELKSWGADIRSEWNRDPMGQRYVRYWLVRRA
jgi:Helix-turn-helix domain